MSYPMLRSSLAVTGIDITPSCKFPTPKTAMAAVGPNRNLLTDAVQEGFRVSMRSSEPGHSITVPIHASRELVPAGHTSGGTVE
jgi:hypothetical protein